MRHPIALLLAGAALTQSPALAQPSPDKPSPDKLRFFHERLASAPHMSGTPGDALVIERLASMFRDMGIADVKVDEFWPLLSTPVAAELELLSPIAKPLDLREKQVTGDPTVAALDLSSPLLIPFNAYSASGDVKGQVVYANNATKEDFERLKQLGVDCTGKIVIARYGGNFRGYKAHFAQAAGAAGLIIFNDPGDVGYAKGLPYPEGTFANECCSQRGTILTLPYQGDPLTPGYPATKDAPRLDESAVDLPKIPVQPVGYGVAQEILSRMTGAEVPDAWQGGLPFRYRLTGGDELQVRLHVEQPRSIKKTANVIATIPGATRPDELVIVGCHHDAWVMGATDPLCGTIVLLETARLIAQRAKEGHPPDRTIIFAAWGAEEWGIIGSSEWVEANEARLRDHAVLYVNLDVASMGLDFSASASPMIRALITKAAAATPSPRDPAKTVLDAWRDRTPAEHWSPPFGDMGGGSDHVGFLCRTGVSSCGLSSSGGRGFSYHSAYDSLPWYWRAVGPGYESAVMQTGVTNEIATHAANDPILPYEPGDVFRDLVAHLDTVIAKAPAAFKDADAAVSRLKLLRASAASLAEKADATMTAVRAAPAATHDTLNAILRRLDRVWLEHDGLPERTWFRNIYSSPDENAGYAPWTLPLLMRALDRHDAAELDAAADRYQRATQRASSILGDLAAAAGQR